jgi:hypothetical protein
MTEVQVASSRDPQLEVIEPSQAFIRRLNSEWEGHVKALDILSSGRNYPCLACLVPMAELNLKLMRHSGPADSSPSAFYFCLLCRIEVEVERTVLELPEVLLGFVLVRRVMQVLSFHKRFRLFSHRRHWWLFWLTMHWRLH